MKPSSPCLDWLSRLSASRASSRLGVVALSSVVFLGSLKGGFVFDDAEAVVANADVQGRTGLGELWRNDFWGRPMASPASHKSWRPLTTLTFRWNAWLAPSAWGYHVVNVALHSVVSLLVLEGLGDILEECQVSSPHRTALLAALLFAVHPVHTESVAGIVGRAELLSGVFYLLSLLCYLRRKPLASTLLFAAAGLLAKEQGVTVLGLCAAYEAVVRNRLTPPGLLRAFAQRAADRANNNVAKPCPVETEIVPRLRRLGLLALAAVSLCLFRLWVADFSAPKFSAPDNPAAFHPSALVRGLNYAHLHSLNAWLLLAPAQLCFDYSMGCIPLITEAQDPRLLSTAAFVLALAWAVARFLRLPDSPSKRALWAAALLFAVPFLPASHLFIRVGFVLAERVLYLPSIGFCLATALGLEKLERRLGKLVPKLALFLLAAHGAKCWQRSEDWRDEVALFSSGSRVCPRNAKVHYNLGKVLADAGDESRAVSEYRLALELEPSYEQALNNLANILKDRGGLGQARPLLVRALSIRPTFAAAWMNLGIVEAGLGAWEEAESAYAKAMSLRPHYPDALFNLGNLHLARGRPSQALSAWRNATLLEPRHAKAWLNQMILLDSEGDCEGSAQLGARALELLPHHAGLHFSLGSCLGKLGRLAEAERHIAAAVRLAPEQASYHANLGVLYHRWGRLREAAAEYGEALRLDPHLEHAQANLQLLRRTKTEGNETLL